MSRVATSRSSMTVFKSGWFSGEWTSSTVGDITPVHEQKHAIKEESEDENQQCKRFQAVESGVELSNTYTVKRTQLPHMRFYLSSILFNCDESIVM